VNAEVLYSDSIGLDARRYRLSRDARGLDLHCQQPLARRAKIHSAAQGKLLSSYDTLTSLALGIFIFLLSIGVWGIRKVVKEFHEEYASQEVGGLPLSEADRRLVPKVITLKEYARHHKIAKNSRRIH
jgi:hypothetical protein